MATLELKFGDLFKAEADAIGHGTNTHGKMGAGIAVIFRKKFPEMHERYKTLCNTFGDSLGGRTYLYFADYLGDPGYSYVANIFSQKAPGANAEVGLLVDGVKDAFAALYGDQEIEKPRLAIPLIGCGIGGLDWDRDVYPALKDLTKSLPKNWELSVISNESRKGFSA